MENRNPTDYQDGAQIAEFNAQAKSAQDIGAAAAERNQAALTQMKRHMEIVTQAMVDPNSLDASDPEVRRMLGARAAALSSALRSIGRK